MDLFCKFELLNIRLFFRRFNFLAVFCEKHRCECFDGRPLSKIAPPICESPCLFQDLQCKADGTSFVRYHGI